MSDAFPQPENPYAAPIVGDLEGDDVETVRRAHLNHEASIRSFGLLYYLGGAIWIMGGIGMIALVVSTLNGTAEPNALVVSLVLVGVYLGLGTFQILVGRGLRRLTTLGRTGGTLFSIIGLLGFPLGTLICGYLLYLLWSAKGNVVFSPEYQRIIQATPHIVYKTSIVVWVFLFILLAALVLPLLAIMLGAI